MIDFAKNSTIKNPIRANWLGRKLEGKRKTSLFIHFPLTFSATGLLAVKYFRSEFCLVFTIKKILFCVVFKYSLIKGKSTSTF